jgi:C-terminal processing protease CtpA/Prc
MDGDWIEWRGLDPDVRVPAKPGQGRYGVQRTHSAKGTVERMD